MAGTAGSLAAGRPRRVSLSAGRNHRAGTLDRRCTRELPGDGAEVTAATVAAGVHVYAGKTAGRFRFEAGPGTRWGWVHLTGRPDAGSTLEGRSLSAAWGGPEVRARAAYGGGGRRVPVVAIELGAGYVALPVRGLRDGTAPVYAVEGPWISLGLDVGLGF